MSENLGIRARRSKTTKLKKHPSAIETHTLDDDLPFIRDYAKKYEEIDPNTRKVLERYIFPGQTLDYYYGSYIATFQLFTMAHMSKNEMAAAIMGLVHTISHKIVSMIDGARKQIAESQKIEEIANTAI